MKRSIGLTLALGILISVSFGIGVSGSALAVHAGTPPGHAVDLLWHDDELWNTNLLGNLHGKIPGHTLDPLYMIQNQNPVAGAGPRDSDYNGGRWLPTIVQWIGAGQQPLFTDGDEVEAALADGDLVVVGMGDPFLCPLTNPNDSA